MEIDISHIYNELNNIIDKCEYKYKYKIILYTLSGLELINIIKNTYKIPLRFIKILKYLEKYMNCYIDFDSLLYISHNQKKIIINNNIYKNNNVIFNNINDMLKKDMKLLNNINNMNNDEYGKINKIIINSTKRLFNLIDKDNDGYINVLDILDLLEINKSYKLLFDENFYCKITKLLIKDREIDYYSFLKCLF